MRGGIFDVLSRDNFGPEVDATSGVAVEEIDMELIMIRVDATSFSSNRAYIHNSLDIVTKDDRKGIRLKC